MKAVMLLGYNHGPTIEQIGSSRNAALSVECQLFESPIY